MATDSPFVLGTRGSALALAQTTLTLQALQRARPAEAFETREIRTTGDKRQDLSLTHVAPGGHGYEPTTTSGGTSRDPQQPLNPAPPRVDPGLFTKELETELLSGAIHIAIHSLKDLPTVMPAGLRLAAVLPRAEVADVLILKPGHGGGLRGVPAGALVATSSLRRQRQLLWHRPDLRVCEIRGNVGTRLQKLLDHDDWAGIVLARAGLERLGYTEELASGFLQTERGRFETEILGPETMLPAVGQGAIGLQARADDARTLDVLAAVNHAETWATVTAERALLSLLGGGCQLPLGVTTTIDPGAGTLRLRAVFFPDEDAPPRLAEAVGPLAEPAVAAQAVAGQLL